MKRIKFICLFTVLLSAAAVGVFSPLCSNHPTVVSETVGIERECMPGITYDITSVEREMLARLVHREGNTESIECQRAIVSVVINRWQSGLWGDTLEEVIYAENQFEPANLLYCTTPMETNYEVVDYIIENGVTIPEYVMYFRIQHHFKWDGYAPYKKIDHTYFGYMEKDKGEQHEKY